ncbi:MAG: hypothetical protein KAQ66_07945 [Rhodospirillaceae bacterium]|nr:hypothetical protein [Rhodospirillaceae bacterium]
MPDKPNQQPLKVTPPSKPEDMHWLVRPKTIKKLWVGGIALLVAMVALGAFAHPHVYFGIEGTFGFFAWYGFVTCVIMVVGAKVLGLMIKRGDDYYD